MADKFRRTFPLKISFSNGEQPTAAKLTAIAEQSRYGSSLLESAIGDLWNESGDSLLTSFELQIPNLARLIGQNQLLNPAIYYLAGNIEFTETSFGARYDGSKIGYTLFKPKNDLPTLPTITGTNNNGITVTASAVTVNGDNVHIDLSTGRLMHAWSEGFESDTALVYNVDPSTWISGNEAVPGIIPDPRQLTYTRCRLSTDGTSYYLHLPPRTALDLDNFEKPDRYPYDADLPNNVGAETDDGGTLPFRMFHPSSGDALNNSFYRYQFPKELAEAINTLPTYTPIPKGYLYLWDHDTNSIVRDAVFYRYDKSTITFEWKWILKVESASSASDFAAVAAASTDEGVDSYDDTNGRYSLICVGTSLAQSIKMLYKHATAHSHSNQGDMSAIISHNALADTEASGTGVDLLPSQWTNDSHIGLLSRAGSGHSRDLNDNAMLGDLIIASSIASGAGSRLNTSNDSFKLYFGSTSGGNIYWSNSNNAITINTDVLFNDNIKQASTVSNAITYWNSNTLSNSANFTYDGIDVVIAGNLGGGGLTLDSTTGAGIFIDRANLTTKSCRLRYGTAGDSKWGVELVETADILKIVDVDNNSEAIRFTQSDTGETVVNEGGTSRDFRVEGDTDTHLLFIDGSTDRVGIGTDTPLSLFHLESASEPDIRLSLSSVAGYFKTYKFNQYTSRIQNVSNNAASYLQLEAIPNISAQADKDAFVGINRETDTTGDAGLAVYTADGTDSLNCQLGCNTDSFFGVYSGNVGIRTSSPAQELHIDIDSDNNVAAIQVEHDGTGTGQASAINLVTDGDGTALGGASNKGWNIQAYGAGYATSPYPNCLRFAYRDGLALTNSVLFLDNGGNIGVGTDSPSSNLHIHEPIASQPVVMTLTPTSTNEDAIIYLSDIGNNSNGGFVKYDGTGNTLQLGGRAGSVDTPYFYIGRDSGHINIGEAPTSTEIDFHINKGSANGAVHLQLEHDGVFSPTNGQITSLNLMTKGDGNYVGFSSNNQGWMMRTWGDQYVAASEQNKFAIRYWNGSNTIEGVSIEPGGDVGIGTLAPTEKLDVNGTVKTSEDFVSSKYTSGIIPTVYCLGSFVGDTSVTANVAQYVTETLATILANTISVGDTIRIKVGMHCTEMTLCQISSLGICFGTPSGFSIKLNDDGTTAHNEVIVTAGSKGAWDILLTYKGLSSWQYSVHGTWMKNDTIDEYYNVWNYTTENGDITGNLNLNIFHYHNYLLSGAASTVNWNVVADISTTP